MRATYVGYEGDRPVVVGTKADVARFWGVREETVASYTAESYRNRRRGSRNARMVVKVEDENNG